MEESVILACKTNDEMATECVKTILSKSTSLKNCCKQRDQGYETIGTFLMLVCSANMPCLHCVYQY